MLLNIPFLDSIVKGDNSRCRKQPLGDYVDSMHHYVTGYILGVFALLVGSKQHFGNPIDCFISAETDKVRTWQAYILSYCFMQGTFRYDFGLNFTRPVLFVRDQIDMKYISVRYYQWVPLFFVFQLLCFMMPDLFWSYVQSYLCVDMSMVVTESSELNVERCSSNRLSKLKNIAEYIFNYFYYRKIARRGFISSLFRLPAIATAFYVITKFLYLLNAILQLYLTTFFLGFPDMHWGLKIMFTFLKQQLHPSIPGMTRGFTNGGLSHFPYFPLEVGCNYTKIENNNNLHISSIQCIIPLNYINEKLFLILWFWIVILIVITMVNIAMFILTIMKKSHRQETIFSFLREKDEDFLNKNGNLAHKFVHSFMGADGVLLMRFITAKAGSLNCRDVVEQLWLKYSEERGGDKKASSDDEWTVPYSEHCYAGIFN